MLLTGKSILSAFTQKHPPVRSWVNSWVTEVENAVWKTSHDIKRRYQTASFLGFNVVIFNVSGNSYRLVTQVLYGGSQTQGVVNVKWAGTHAEYSKMNFV
jgi:mRNA interferase HigB